MAKPDLYSSYQDESTTKREEATVIKAREDAAAKARAEAAVANIPKKVNTNNKENKK